MGCGSSSEPQPRPAPKPKVVEDTNNNNRPPVQKSPREKHYHTSSQNGDLHKESTDKGYKRRLRKNMVEASHGNDLEALEKAVAKFEQNNLEDCGDLTDAKDKLNYLRLRRDLRDAIRRSHVGTLERTLDEAYNSPHQNELTSQIQAAEKKLRHLKELNEYSHDILAMDQQTISEIHTYHRPPACVHDVMAASYMLLGYNESELRDWSYLQSIAGRVGRESLIHQVRDFDSNNVDEPTAQRVREILDYHLLTEVRVASNGAAAFYVWSDNIVEKVNKDNQEEEDDQMGTQNRPRDAASKTPQRAKPEAANKTPQRGKPEAANKTPQNTKPDVANKTGQNVKPYAANKTPPKAQPGRR